MQELEGGTHTFEEYIARAIHAERRADLERYVTGEQAYRANRAPNALRWLVNWAVEPWAQPSRARSERSTSGHSLSMIEK
jgi:hypothetical protein